MNNISQNVRNEVPKFDTEVYDAINNFKGIRVTIKNSKNLRDVFDVMQKVQEQEKDIPYVVLYFADQSGRVVRFISINSNFLRNFEDFESRINEISAGEVFGSDAINTRELFPLVDRFDTIFVSLIGKGNFNDFLFKSYKIDGGFDGLCGMKSLKTCIEFLDKKSGASTTASLKKKMMNDELKNDLWEKRFKLKKLNNIREFINHHNLKIGVIHNTFKFKKSFLELIDKKEKENIEGIEDIVIGKKKYKVFKLKVSDIEYSVTRGNVEESGQLSKNHQYLIYDSKHEHISVLKEMKFDNMYMTLNKKIFKKIENKGKIKYRKITYATEIFRKNIKCHLTEASDVKIKYLFLDYETVVDWKKWNIMIPYSLSCLCINVEELNKLDEIDKEIEEMVEEERKRKKKLLLEPNGDNIIQKLYKIFNTTIKCDSLNIIGFDCNKKLLDWIKKNQKHTLFKIITFNGVNFDNFLLLDGCLRYDGDIVSRKSIFYNGKQLLNFKIFGRHDLFDIRKHVTGSLRKCCKDFRLNLLSKTVFDHNESQSYYDQGILMEQLNKKEVGNRLKLYNELDVVSTAIVFNRYKNTLYKSLISPGIKYYKNKIILEKIKTGLRTGLKENIEKTKIKCVKENIEFSKFFILPKIFYDKFQLTDNKTIGSFIYTLMKEYWRAYEINIPKMFYNNVDIKNKCNYNNIYDLAILERKAKNDNWLSIKENKKELEEMKKKVEEDKENNKKIREEIPKFNNRLYKYYKDILKFKIAGRVELFNTMIRIMDREASPDVKSEYPYVASVEDVFYPSGEIIEVEKYQEMPKNSLGFFYCDIDQKELIKKNLPNVICEKTKIKNNWKTDKVLENYFISTVMIDLIIKYCGRDEIIIKNGIYFSKKIKSYKLFKPLLSIMIMKNHQDHLKRIGSKEYNKVLRNTLKLLLNSVTGKVIESLHCDKVKAINEYEYDKIKNNKKTKSINCINIIVNKVFASYTVDEESEMAKHRPIYYGVFIYDYAKRYMYEHMYSKIGKKASHYTDTDSCKMTYKTFEKWRNEYGSKTIIPHWKELEELEPLYKTEHLFENTCKLFGGFEDELSEKNNFNIFITKKNYISAQVTSNIREIEHMSFKGVGKTDVMLDLSEDILMIKYYKQTNPNSKSLGKFMYVSFDNKIYNKKGELVKSINKEQFEMKVLLKNYVEIARCTNNKNLLKDDYNHYKKTYDFYNNNKNNISIKFVELFESLYQNKEAYILCQNISKSVGNQKRNVDIKDKDRMNKRLNKIFLNYTVKHIKINEKREDEL